MFHSGASGSSIATNVGSPPIVMRTSSVLQLLLDAPAELVDGEPLLVAVRLRDARRLDDALHAHQVLERRLAFLDARR